MVVNMSDTSTDEKKPRVSINVLIVCGTIAFIICLAAFVVLSVLKIDTAQYIAFLAFALGSIPGTAAWKNSQDVKHQTNGPLTARLDGFDERLNQQDQVLEERLNRQDTLLHEIMRRLDGDSGTSTV